MMIAIKKRAVSLISVWATGIFCLSFQAGALAAIPIQQWTQPGGAQVYLVESPAIAMVDVQIDFDAGTRRDPAAQAGLASMATIMLDKGLEAKNGAPAMDENALSEAWADLGAQFGASVTGERLGFSLRSLTDPELLDKAVALAARQIAEPSFPGAIWQRERERMVASLKE
ncbi:MAG: insulinase family protein, partial [Bacteroidia bacterium]|nr:insulinase family protein [Bacteroidia bacterium]